MIFVNATEIFFDLDGVLADWVERFENVTGMSIGHFNSLPEEERDLIKENFGYEFFRNIVPIERGMNLFRDVRRDNPNARIAILSAYGDFNQDEVQRAKIEWVREYVCEDIEVILVERLTHKARYATPTSVLIDDRVKATNAFSAAGGCSFLFV